MRWSASTWWQKGPWGLIVQWVTAADPGALQLAVGLEVGDDRLGGALGDADAGGDVTQADIGVTVDGQQHACMEGQERPCTHLPGAYVTGQCSGEHVCRGLAV